MNDVSIPLARLRLWGHRVQLRRWVATFVLAGVAALGVARAISSANAVAAQYGDHTAVIVVTNAVASGDTITEHDVRSESWPRRFVVPEAVSDTPIGAVAVRDLVVGQVVSAPDLRAAPDLRRGELAIAIPHDLAALPVAAGDHVALHAVTISATDAHLIAARLPVVEVTEFSVIVAASEDEAAEVAWTLANGAITISRSR